MKKVRIEITGVIPMLMHADTLADPLDPKTKEFKRVSGKRTKTDDDHEQMSKMEFESSLYLDADGRICVPAANIKKCLIEGGRITKQGVKIERGLTLLGVDFRLNFPGDTKDPFSLYNDKSYVDRRSVKVGTAKTMRTRPIFRDWSFVAEAFIDPAILDTEDLSSIVSDAGNLIGLSDHRKVGGFGRFTARVVEI